MLTDYSLSKESTSKHLRSTIASAETENLRLHSISKPTTSCKAQDTEKEVLTVVCNITILWLTQNELDINILVPLQGIAFPRFPNLKPSFMTQLSTTCAENSNKNVDWWILIPTGIGFLFGIHFYIWNWFWLSNSKCFNQRNIVPWGHTKSGIRQTLAPNKNLKSTAISLFSEIWGFKFVCKFTRAFTSKPWWLASIFRSLNCSLPE